MKFCIDASYIGTTKHLIVEDDGFYWTDDVPASVLHFSGKIKQFDNDCFDTLVSLSGMSVKTVVPEQHVRALSIVAPDMITPPWKKIMPSEAHKSFVVALVNELKDIHSSVDQGYFRNTWVHGNSLLQKLQPCHVDTATTRSLIAMSEGNVAALKTFLCDGISSVPVYNRLGTRTGRTIISSGPDILTLKKDHRRIIKSAFGDRGRIVSLDFSAIEIRVLLYDAGGTCEADDLYEDLNQRLFGGTVKRQTIKAALICLMYGASKKGLDRKLNISVKDLSRIIEQIKKHFKLDVLKKRLKDEYIRRKHVSNYYGRSLHVDEPLDHIFINTFAQSTGVDVAMIGFNKRTDELDPNKCRPIFILHDGLFLDVLDEYVPIIEEKKHIKIDGFDQDFVLALV